MGVFSRSSKKDLGRSPAYLAIDVGGTKTLLAVFSLDGQIISSNKIATNHNYKTFLTDIQTAVQSLGFSFKSCGLAVPGTLNRSRGTVERFGNIPWKNVPMRHDFEKLLGLEVAVENDANMAGVSEATELKNKYKRVAYMTLSTGINVKLIINGMISQDVAEAEPGFMIFEHEGKLTEWEEFASGAALFDKYGKKAVDIDDPNIWKEYSYCVAKGLYQLFPIYQPEVVIVGGGVGAHLEKFAEPLKEQLAKFKSHMVDIPPIVKAKRPEEAVIYGCYELAKQNA